MMMDEVELIEALRSLDRPVDPPEEDRDEVWRAVSLQMSGDLVDVRADDRHRPPGIGGLTLGRGLWRMAAAAAVVLVVGLGAVWLGGPESRLVDGVTERPDSGTMELPDSHPAAGLLARGVDDATEFSELARREGLAFQCASGGTTQVCFVYADGLLAVVPLAAGPGFTATVRGGAVEEELKVPLDDGAVAVPGPGGRLTAVIQDATGTEMLSTGAALSDPQPPGPSQEIREPFISGAQGQASFAVGASDSGLCAEAGGANQRLASCGRGDRLAVVAFQADEHIVVAGYIPAPVGSITAVLDDEQRFALDLRPVPEQSIVAFGLVERATTEFVRIEVRDQDGELVQTHFPSLGPTGD